MQTHNHQGTNDEAVHAVAKAGRTTSAADRTRDPEAAGRARGVLRARMVRVATAEDGMSTVEYAIGTIAAAAFGAILYTVVTGDSVVGALTRLISRALETSL